MTVIDVLKKWDSLYKFNKDLRYEIFFFKLKRKLKKTRYNRSWQNEDKNMFCPFFKCLLDVKAHALQSELREG